MMKTNPDGFSDHMFERLGALQAVQRSFEILFDNLCTFVTVGLLAIPYIVVVVAYVSLMAGGDQTTTNTYVDANGFLTTTTTTEPQVSLGAAFGMIVLMLLFIPVLYTSVAATIRATAEIYAGERPEVGAVLKVGVHNICRLLCFGLVMVVPLLGLIVVAGIMVALVVATSGDDGVSNTAIILVVVLFPLWIALFYYVIIPFQMAPPSVVLEQNMSVMGVLSRTWSLSSGGRCNIFLALLILFCVNFIVGLIPLVGLFWSLLSMPLHSILATVLFLNLRVEKEGLNRSGLRGELGMDMMDETELVPEIHVKEVV